MRILLVDDQVLFGEGLAALLRGQADFEILGRAATAAEAVEMSSQLEPDLVLMDVSLPDGSGIDAAALILARRPCIRVIILTVADDEQTMLAAIRAGTHGFVPKNTSLSKLVELICDVGRGHMAFPPAITTRLVDLLRQSPQRQYQEDDCAGLTDREREVLRRLELGATNRRIAEELVISENTVKNHVQHILTKLNLRSRKEISSRSRARP